jgi:hypothetical protein
MNGFVLHPDAYTDVDDCVGRTLLSAAVDVDSSALDPDFGWRSASALR